MTGLLRQLEAALLPRRHENLNQTGEQALVGLDLNIKLGSEEKHDGGKQHEADGDAKTDDPAVFILDIHDDGECDHEGYSDGGVVKVEESLEDSLVVRVFGVVVLVGPEGHGAGPHAPRPDGHQGECRE